MLINLHIIATTFFSIESLVKFLLISFSMYTPMYTGLEFFMGMIVQLADLMEAATWMTTSCSAALTPRHAATACAAFTPRLVFRAPCLWRLPV